MRQEKPARARGIRGKILLPAAVVVVAMSLIMGAAAYLSLWNGMIPMGVEEAGMAARAAAEVIDGDLLDEIVPGCEDGEAYQTLLADMRRVQQSFGIAFLYTLYTDGSAVYYGVDTDQSEDQCAVGEVFETSYEELSGVFRGESYAQDYIDHTDDGDLITAYLPIRDSAGRVAGVIGCDYDASGVSARLWRMVGLTALICLACMAVGLLVMNAVVGRIMKGLDLVNRKLYDLVHSDGDIGRQLDVHTGDELETIAGNVNVVLSNTYAQAQVAQEVSRGNLTVEVRPASDKDLLGNSLKRLVEQNGRALRGIRDAAEQAKSGADQMAGASETLARCSMEQAGTVEEITAAIKTISQQTDRNAETSEQASGLINQAIGRVEEGNRRMGEMVAAMREIGRAAQGISEIIKTIDDIASETNILALNASVEAARAGSAGKGFAVIAQNIRDLASSSAAAAARTSALIEASVSKAAAGERIADDMAAALGSLTRSVEECVEKIRAIAAACAQQSSAIAEVDRAVDQVANVVQTNSSISQQCAAASAELLEQMKTVDRMLSVYRLE